MSIDFQQTEVMPLLHGPFLKDCSRRDALIDNVSLIVFAFFLTVGGLH